MRRGLKRIVSVVCQLPCHPLNVHPDEKGIETHISARRMVLKTKPLNVHPDEKGIETSVCSLTLSPQAPLNVHPDEKGTETQAGGSAFAHLEVIALVTRARPTPVRLGWLGANQRTEL